MTRIALAGFLLVAASCGDTAGTVATSATAPATTGATTASQAPIASTTTLATAIPISDQPPWEGIPFATTEVPAVVAEQWRASEVRGFCSAMYPSAPLPAGAVIRSADFSGGWAVAWDMPNGSGRFPTGDYCEDCGRGAFGIAGAFGPAVGDENEVWDRQLEWLDGSKAGFGFEGLTDGSQGEPLLMYLLVEGEGCLYNLWSFLGEAQLLEMVDGLRFVEGLRGEATSWLNQLPPPEVVEMGTPSWVTEPPLTEVDEAYALEWAGEAQAPQSCPMLAYADLGGDAADATIRRAANEGEMLLAWDRPSGPGHDGGSNYCADCGRGAIGLGTFQGGGPGDRPVTRRWSDGSTAATFEGLYGTEAYLQPDGFDCVYWMWSHLGADHLDYLLTQLRRVEGYP